MYVAKRFEEKDPEVIREFIRTNGFATLVSVAEGRPVATHIPLELNRTGDQEFLLGHVARANRQWQSLGDQMVMAIFLGPHAHITPTWYEEINVPTWNYAAVHVYGKASIVEDPAELRAMLKQIVDKYESRHANRYTVEKLPAEYYEDHVKALVGIKIRVDAIEANFKLSQNRNDRDYRNIVDHLDKSTDSNERGVAELMKTKRP